MGRSTRAGTSIECGRDASPPRAAAGRRLACRNGSCGKPVCPQGPGGPQAASHRLMSIKGPAGLGQWRWGSAPSDIHSDIQMQAQQVVAARLPHGPRGMPPSIRLPEGWLNRIDRFEGLPKKGHQSNHIRANNGMAGCGVKRQGSAKWFNAFGRTAPRGLFAEPKKPCSTAFQKIPTTPAGAKS